MSSRRVSFLLVPLLLATSPAAAQLSRSDAHKFLDAIKNEKAQDVTDMLATPGNTLINTQDPGTGAINPFALAPGYFETPGEAGAEGLAYSAVPDDPDEFFTGSQTAATALVSPDYHERSSFRMVGSAVAGIFVVGVVALVVSLAIAIRPTANVRPSPNQNVVVAPTRPAPAPAAPAPAPAAPAPAPEAVPQAPAAAPAPPTRCETSPPTSCL